MAPFGLAIFIGAFLLFQVQPLIGKYILPWFGGAPSVWTTCMLFFQVVLLGGYAYAHLISSRLNLRWQAVVQLVLTAAALCLLPAVPSESWKPVDAGDPTLRILGLLAVTIGLPYLVLAASSPLLQHWFARTHPGRSPYRLYALSNIGSLLALASYPTLFEPHLTRQNQARLWALGMVAYCAGLCVCVWNLRTTKPAHRPGLAPVSERKSGRPLIITALWVLLPACASALLLATTNKMCQEVAVVPFLWVVPLGLYLLSFVICFDSPRWYHRLPFGLGLLGVMGAVCWALFHWTDISVPAQMVIYGTACFVCCMVCHGEVYRLKPEPAGLTAFYLMIALGGALGGIFVGLLAPLLFNDYFELQWGLALCALLFVLLVKRDLKARSQLCKFNDHARSVSHKTGSVPPVSARPALDFLHRWKSKLFNKWAGSVSLGFGAAWLAMVIAFVVQAHQKDSVIIAKVRNFYGVLTLFERTDPTLGISLAKLVHGRTSHGLQFRDPARARWPTMYYNERSGVGLAIKKLPEAPRRIGVVGLGVGTLATYGRTGDLMRFYEINPAVVQLARTRFTYLKDCHAHTEVVLGDARLTMEKEPPQAYDLLVLDAFSSDAIPVHLLTEEAFKLYARHLKSTGVLAVHVSNRSLDLEPVVANAASQLGYTATLVDYRSPPEKWWVSRSKWILLTKGDAPRLENCCNDAKPARPDLVRVPLWTDDFTSLFQVLWRPSAWDIQPSTAELELKAALESASHGDNSNAVKHYRAALENEPDLATALNNLAWILATSSDPTLRDGGAAVQYARHACELTDYRTTLLVGTLAAAYAEAGQFTEAVATAEKACQLASDAHDDNLLQRNRQLLQLYREARPVRE